MKKILGILLVSFVLSGCAPNTVGVIGNNENSVNVNVNILDRGKGPNYEPTLAKANEWCGQFGKTAKFIRNSFSGFMYSCNWCGHRADRKNFN